MHAAVVGAGIMGRLLAMGLIRHGWEISVFDEHPASETANNCSQAAAGLLTPACELDKAEPLIYTLGQDALQQYWPKILGELKRPIFFQQQGCIVVHHPRDHDEWQFFSRRISSKVNCDYQCLNHDSLIELEPALHKFSQGYFFPYEGQIDAQELLHALGIELQAKVTWKTTKVVSLQPYQVQTPDNLFAFDWVFDCRGLGAKANFNNLRALRGELIWLHAPEVLLHRPLRFLHPRYSIYVAPRANHQFLIGATELEAEDYSEISVRSTLELLSAAYYLNAGFAEARIIKTVTQCRPALPHQLPVIKRCEGLIAINGLYRHGYLIAPTLTEEVIRGIPSQTQHLHYPELWEIYDHHIH